MDPNNPYQYGYQSYIPGSTYGGYKYSTSLTNQAPLGQPSYIGYPPTIASGSSGLTSPLGGPTIPVSISPMLKTETDQ